MNFLSSTLSQPFTTASQRVYSFPVVPHGRPGLQSRSKRQLAAPKSRGFFMPVRPVYGWPGGSSRKTGRCLPGTATPVRSPTQLQLGWRLNTAAGVSTMSALTVLTSEIRLHDGLYSLNDLHKASGNARKHQPANFMRVESTMALITEIHSTDLRSATNTVNGGLNRGTYVCRELVYAYAMWISPKFHLAVIRAFDGQHNAAIPPISAIPRRWMLSTDYTGQRQIHPIPNDAYILTPSTMLRILVSPGDCLEVTDAQLAEFIGAASNRLRQRIIKREHSVNALRAGVQ